MARLIGAAAMLAWRLAVVVLLGVCGAQSALAQQLQPIPSLQARVTDTTATLDPAQVAELESALAALEARKGTQVAVLMVPTTAPEAIEQYSLRAAEAWKVGRGKVDGKAVDDGLLLVVAKNDRRVRIEVGYGLEGAIPDVVARRIIAESIAPRFRNQDYFGGLKAGIGDITARIDGESLPPPWHDAQRGDDGGGLGTLLPVLLFAFVGGTILSRIVGRFLGAAGAGIGAAVMGYSAVGSLLLALAIAAGIFVLVLLIGGGTTGGGTRGGPMRRVGRRTYRDGPVFIPGPWGGGGFGGGGGGGFGGGGGWSGGGGSFGGGGASGDW